jgi:outer membrane protein assembly factor BamD
MTIKKYFIYSLIASLLVLLTACAGSTDPADAYPGESAQQIFQGGEDALRDKNYKDASKHFEALDAQYPYGRNTETAQLHIIYAYYMDSEYLSAEAAADRFIHAYPANPHVDYAYYMRGLANYYQNMGIFERIFSIDFATRDLTQVKKSFNDFAQLQRRYPDSPYAPAAHQYTLYLRNVLANHQLNVAEYYFKREAYVASANRASIMVEHYEGAPRIPDALVMMAKSYYQLHLTDQMNQTIEVLNYNYPNSKYMAEVTGRELSSKSFSIITRNDVVVPTQKLPMSPPADASSGAYPAYSANGDRNSVVRPVSELVKSIRESDWFNRKTTNTTPPQAANQPQTTASDAGVNKAPVEAASRGPRNGNGQLTLSDLLAKLSNSTFFATHSKNDKQATTDAQGTLPDDGGQGVASSNNTAMEQAQQTIRPALADNGSRR